MCASCTDVPLATFARCVAAASPACMVAASRVGPAVLRVVGAMVDLVACGGAIIGEESAGADAGAGARSEEHTSELQSLMRISYAVFCLKKKIRKQPPLYLY